MKKRGQIISERNFWILVLAIIIVALIFGDGKLSNNIILFLIGLLLINPTLSFFINKWISGLKLDWLDEINLTCEIEEYEFSITAYALLSEVLLFLIF